MFRILLILFYSISLIGCEQIALSRIHKKKAVLLQSTVSNVAEEKFWDTLHRGQYEEIDQAKIALLKAYLENPNNPHLASHLGFLHIWQLTERARNKNISPLIVNQIILAKKYFQDSFTLDSEDARVIGFLADARLVEASIFQDQRENIKAYFQLQRAIKAWPEFNYFAAGYPMSILNYDSAQFKEALEWQWKTLDLCALEKINRADPNYTKYMVNETRRGEKRACWNNWIAPHNFEGFFLNMGDMLVKAGQWQTAIQIYQNAKLSKQYKEWPFRQLLESRILNAKTNVSNFRKDLHSADKTVLFNTGYGCVVCHQAK